MPKHVDSHACKEALQGKCIFHTARIMLRLRPLLFSLLLLLCFLRAMRLFSFYHSFLFSNEECPHRLAIYIIIILSDCFCIVSLYYSKAFHHLRIP